MKINWPPIYEFVESLPGPEPDWALNELKRELMRMNVGIDVRLLGIPDAYPEGGWCIHQEDDVWLVYHCERGRRSGCAIFTSAFDAANFYLWSRLSHPSAGNSDVGRLPRKLAS